MAKKSFEREQEHQTTDIMSLSVHINILSVVVIEKEKKECRQVKNETTDHRCKLHLRYRINIEKFSRFITKINVGIIDGFQLSVNVFWLYSHWIRHSQNRFSHDRIVSVSRTHFCDMDIPFCWCWWLYFFLDFLTIELFIFEHNFKSKLYFHSIFLYFNFDGRNPQFTSEWKFENWKSSGYFDILETKMLVFNLKKVRSLKSASDVPVEMNEPSPILSNSTEIHPWMHVVTLKKIFNKNTIQFNTLILSSNSCLLANCCFNVILFPFLVEM